jgi:hypothetical protein
MKPHNIVFLETRILNSYYSKILYIKSVSHIVEDWVSTREVQCYIKVIDKFLILLWYIVITIDYRHFSLCGEVYTLLRYSTLLVFILLQMYQDGMLVPK